MKKIMLFAIFVAFLGSCSSDNDGGSEFKITHFIQEYQATHNGETEPYTRTKIRTDLKDGKLFSRTYYNMETGEVADTEQPYEYSNGLLMSENYGFGYTEYFYDANNNMIASSWYNDTMESGHYRFVYVSANIVYNERLTLPYDDPAATIINRIILQFDADNNVVAAGEDADLDGAMDHTNLFIYNNNNLTGSETWDGGGLQYSPSEVINNFSVIYDKTYGKKAARLLDASRYIQVPFSWSPTHSLNVLQSQIDLGEYQVLGNGYFRKSYVENTFVGGHGATTVTFYFNGL